MDGCQQPEDEQIRGTDAKVRRQAAAAATPAADATYVTAGQAARRYHGQPETADEHDGQERGSSLGKALAAAGCRSTKAMVVATDAAMVPVTSTLPRALARVGRVSIADDGQKQHCSRTS